MIKRSEIRSHIASMIVEHLVKPLCEENKMIDDNVKKKTYSYHSRVIYSNNFYKIKD